MHVHLYVKFVILSIFRLQSFLHSIIFSNISLDIGKTVESFTTIVHTKMLYKLSLRHTVSQYWWLQWSSRNMELTVDNNAIVGG